MRRKILVERVPRCTDRRSRKDGPSRMCNRTDGRRPFQSQSLPSAICFEKKKMDKEVSEMLKADIIEPSISEYASSPVVMGKPDGLVRYCIDFRRLNAKTVVDAEPIPNQEVILNKM